MLSYVNDGLAERGFRRLGPLIQTLIQRPAHDAGIGALGVADLAGLVNGFSGEAEVGNCRFNVPLGNLEVATAPMTGDLTTLLRSVVLIGHRRGDALEKRRQLMDLWATFVAAENGAESRKASRSQ
ncbi:hypothetical protein [Methylobacterium organophilum]|uniref:Uncharacterized protein n=1 Tax=Methylobacterium organophilum TaxID=410 RepID=A0ABQ4TF43_METOR|nr:hypothetical protein [Methylobacterium organophilum]GJE29540.1 hypothetical protein LKMONMHP_4422 [Methylobacterium organophilum]